MSEIKVNKISPRTACGTTTLGDSGDTFTIPAGVTITNSGTAAGFGATGAASWDTTVKTTGFTAVSGVGYFVNTTAGAITVTLPASPSAGDVIAVSDYANNFATNNLTLGRNGSNIGGNAADSVLVVNGAAVTLVYVDATKGWIVTDSGLQSDASELVLYVTATGGTITTSGDYKIHSFTGPGTFCVSCAGNATGSNTTDYMVVAGGGGGSNSNGGGGGAGGFRMASSLPVSVTGFPITIGGAGGAAGGGCGATAGGCGNISTFSTITSTGGGGGGSGVGTSTGGTGRPGGSGGGGGTNNQAAGTGNTPPVSPPQGFPGAQGAGPGTPTPQYAGGGGGASAAAIPRVCTPSSDGGAGSPAAPIFGTAPQPYYLANTSNTGATVSGDFAGGGGGGTEPGSTGAAGGVGGGGKGSTGPGGTIPGNGVAATTNSGGGGGGGGYNPSTGGGGGGSGIILIRYKFQN
jgi:hypothetical protein